MSFGTLRKTAARFFAKVSCRKPRGNPKAFVRRHGAKRQHRWPGNVTGIFLGEETCIGRNVGRCRSTVGPGALAAQVWVTSTPCGSVPGVLERPMKSCGGGAKPARPCLGVWGPARRAVSAQFTRREFPRFLRLGLRSGPRASALACLSKLVGCVTDKQFLSWDSTRNFSRDA